MKLNLQKAEYAILCVDSGHGLIFKRGFLYTLARSGNYIGFICADVLVEKVGEDSRIISLS